MNQTEQMRELETMIEKEHSNIRGIVVLKNGEISYERYFEGFAREDTLHAFFRDQKHHFHFDRNSDR